MTVDNFDEIRELLDFRSDDDFYFLQILQRKKDHKEGTKVNGTNNNSRLIKAYYISSVEYFDFIKPEVIELCKLFNARAGINLNRRSFEKMALHHLRKITEQLINKEYKKAYKAYSSVVGAYSQETDKTWILDIDEMGFDVSTLDEVLWDIAPQGPKVKAVLPSRSGCHVITRPFNVHSFRTFAQYRNIEIHKNNPTNLFFP